MSYQDGAIGPNPHQISMVEEIDPATRTAAERAVLLRVDRGQLTPADALQVLRALGLQPYPAGGHYNPQGRRYRKSRPKPSQSDGSGEPRSPQGDDTVRPSEAATAPKRGIGEEAS